MCAHLQPVSLSLFRIALVCSSLGRWRFVIVAGTCRRESERQCTAGGALCTNQNSVRSPAAVSIETGSDRELLLQTVRLNKSAGPVHDRPFRSQIGLRINARSLTNASFLLKQWAQIVSIHFPHSHSSSSSLSSFTFLAHSALYRIRFPFDRFLPHYLLLVPAAFWHQKIVQF